MAPDSQKPRVTEIQVRMDCYGCVQRIKKSLNGITGINDLYIDFHQQKITIIGWADPETIIKAIRRTRKVATICSHVEPPTESPSSESPSQPPEETALPSSTTEDTNVSDHQSQSSPEAKDAGEVDDEIYRNDPPDSGNRSYGYDHGYVSPVMVQEPHPPIYVTHNYNIYHPSPYVTEYEYVRSSKFTHCSGDFYNDNGNLTSLFNDENPNACTIV